jgi:tetratricopeptide (TPR) repeat protein
MELFTEQIIELHWFLYLAHVNGGMYREAMPYGHEFLRHRPTEEQIVNQMAQIYRLRLNNFEAAAAVWKAFDERFNSFTAKQEIANIYALAENVDQAVYWFNRALDQNRSPDVLQRLANLYINNNQPDRAIAVFQDFLDSNPSQRDRATTYRNMGTLYWDMGNRRLALEKYELFLAIDFNRGIAFRTAQEYFDIGNFDRAAHHLNNLITRNANDWDAIWLNAEMLFNQERFAEARVLFNRLTGHATYGTPARQFIEVIDQQ